MSELGWLGIAVAALNERERNNLNLVSKRESKKVDELFEILHGDKTSKNGEYDAQYDKNNYERCAFDDVRQRDTFLSWASDHGLAVTSTIASYGEKYLIEVKKSSENETLMQDFTKQTGIGFKDESNYSYIYDFEQRDRVEEVSKREYGSTITQHLDYLGKAIDKAWEARDVAKTIDKEGNADRHAFTNALDKEGNSVFGRTQESISNTQRVYVIGGDTVMIGGKVLPEGELRDAMLERYQQRMSDAQEILRNGTYRGKELDKVKVNESGINPIFDPELIKKNAEAVLNCAYKQEFVITTDNADKMSRDVDEVITAYGGYSNLLNEVNSSMLAYTYTKDYVLSTENISVLDGIDISTREALYGIDKIRHSGDLYTNEETNALYLVTKRLESLEADKDDIDFLKNSKTRQEMLDGLDIIEKKYGTEGIGDAVTSLRDSVKKHENDGLKMADLTIRDRESIVKAIDEHIAHHPDDADIEKLKEIKKNIEITDKEKDLIKNGLVTGECLTRDFGLDNVRLLSMNDKELSNLGLTTAMRDKLLSAAKEQGKNINEFLIGLNESELKKYGLDAKKVEAIKSLTLGEKALFSMGDLITIKYEMVKRFALDRISLAEFKTLDSEGLALLGISASMRDKIARDVEFKGFSSVHEYLKTLKKTDLTRLGLTQEQLKKLIFETGGLNILNANGGFNSAVIKLLNEKDFAKLGISKQSMDFVLKLDKKGLFDNGLRPDFSNLTSLLSGIGFRMFSGMTGGGENEEFQQMRGDLRLMRSTTGYGKQTVKYIRMKNDELFARAEIRNAAKEGKNRLKKRAQTEKEKQKKAVKDQKTLEKAAKKNKKQEEWDERRNKMIARSKFYQKFQSSRFNRLMTKLNTARNQLKAFIYKKAVLILKGICTVGAPALALVLAFGVIGIIVVSFVQALLSDPIGKALEPEIPEQTVAYQLYKDLKDKENEWLKGLYEIDGLYADARNEDGKGNKFNYGPKYKTLQNYLNDFDDMVFKQKSDHASIYLNPFYKIEEAEGFSKEDWTLDQKVGESDFEDYFDSEIVCNINNFSVITDGENGRKVGVDDGHTSNIKDIIAMTDIMYDTSLTGGAGYTDEEFAGIMGLSPAGLNWKDKVEGFKNFFKKIANFFGANYDIKNNYCSYQTVEKYASVLFDSSHRNYLDFDVEYMKVVSDDEKDSYIKMVNADGTGTINLGNASNSALLNSGICPNPETSYFILYWENNKVRAGVMCNDELYCVDGGSTNVAKTAPIETEVNLKNMVEPDKACIWNGMGANSTTFAKVESMAGKNEGQYSFDGMNAIKNCWYESDDGRNGWDEIGNITPDMSSSSGKFYKYNESGSSNFAKLVNYFYNSKNEHFVAYTNSAITSLGGVNPSIISVPSSRGTIDVLKELDATTYESNSLSMMYNADGTPNNTAYVHKSTNGGTYGWWGDGEGRGYKFVTYNPYSVTYNAKRYRAKDGSGTYYYGDAPYFHVVDGSPVFNNVAQDGVKCEEGMGQYDYSYLVKGGTRLDTWNETDGKYIDKNGNVLSGYQQISYLWRTNGVYYVPPYYGTRNMAFGFQSVKNLQYPWNYQLYDDGRHVYNSNHSRYVYQGLTYNATSDTYSYVRNTESGNKVWEAPAGEGDRVDFFADDSSLVYNNIYYKDGDKRTFETCLNELADTYISNKNLIGLANTQISSYETGRDPDVYSLKEENTYISRDSYAGFKQYYGRDITASDIVWFYDTADIVDCDGNYLYSMVLWIKPYVVCAAPVKTVYERHCVGHPVEYCSGHLHIHATGIVYSMTNEQLAIGGTFAAEQQNPATKDAPAVYGYNTIKGRYEDLSDAELENMTFYEFVSPQTNNANGTNDEVAYYPKVDVQGSFISTKGRNLKSTADLDLNEIDTKSFKTVDYGDDSKSTDIWDNKEGKSLGDGGGTTGFGLKTSNSFSFMRDIFDVDCNILKAANVFPLGVSDDNAWKNYKGWTSDNMTLAAMKTAGDWYEYYGFDIPFEIGSVPVDYSGGTSWQEIYDDKSEETVSFLKEIGSQIKTIFAWATQGDFKKSFRATNPDEDLDIHSYALDMPLTDEDVEKIVNAVCSSSTSDIRKDIIRSALFQVGKGHFLDKGTNADAYKNYYLSAITFASKVDVKNEDNIVLNSDETVDTDKLGSVYRFYASTAGDDRDFAISMYDMAFRMNGSHGIADYEKKETITGVGETTYHYVNEFAVNNYIFGSGKVNTCTALANLAPGDIIYHKGKGSDSPVTLPYISHIETIYNSQKEFSKYLSKAYIKPYTEDRYAVYIGTPENDITLNNGMFIKGGEPIIISLWNDVIYADDSTVDDCNADYITKTGAKQLGGDDGQDDTQNYDTATEREGFYTAHPVRLYQYGPWRELWFDNMSGVKYISADKVWKEYFSKW